MLKFALTSLAMLGALLAFALKGIFAGHLPTAENLSFALGGASIGMFALAFVRGARDERADEFAIRQVRNPCTDDSSTETFVRDTSPLAGESTKRMRKAGAQ